MTNNNLEAFKLPLWKRLFDIGVSLVALIILSPLLLIIIVAIRLESRGPVIYKSKRVGSNYKIFDFLKFRSMYTDADKNLKSLSALNQYANKQQQMELKPVDEALMVDDDFDFNNILLVSDEYTVQEGDYLEHKDIAQENAFVKLENDPRITKLGRVMRKYSIDELPQLINILKGDMSVVGNRPLPLYEAEMLTEDDYIDRFMAPAGLTGLWQVEKRGLAGKLSAEERKQLDMRYAKEFSFMMDMKIIFKTFTAFIQKENV